MCADPGEVMGGASMAPLSSCGRCVRLTLTSPVGDRYPCATCGRSYVQLAGLHYHQRSAHRPAERWPCPRCDKVFHLQVRLRRHLDTTHVNLEPDLLPRCHVCGKQFKVRVTRPTLARRAEARAGHRGV